MAQVLNKGSVNIDGQWYDVNEIISDDNVRTTVLDDNKNNVYELRAIETMKDGVKGYHGYHYAYSTSTGIVKYYYGEPLLMKFDGEVLELVDYDLI